MILLQKAAAGKNRSKKSGAAKLDGSSSLYLPADFTLMPKQSSTSEETQILSSDTSGLLPANFFSVVNNIIYGNLSLKYSCLYVIINMFTEITRM